MANPSGLLDSRGVAIDFYDTVPNMPGIGLIRLPRCAKCYDQAHDYSSGKAFCIPAELSSASHPMPYERMTDDQLDAWSRMEREEQLRIEGESK